MSSIGSSKLEYTVPLGDHYLHFRTTQETMRNDVISAGVQGNMDPQKLRDDLKKVRFAFSNNLEQRQYKASRSSNPLRRGYESIMAYTPSATDAYVTMPDREGAFECWLFPEYITRSTNKRYVGYPVEVRAAAALHKLLDIWAHERAHVLQNLDPAKLERQRRGIAISSAVVGLGMTASVTALVSWVVPGLPYELVRGTTVAAAAGEVAIVGAIATHAWFVADERESQAASRAGIPNWQSPIEMIIEK